MNAEPSRGFGEELTVIVRCVGLSLSSFLYILMASSVYLPLSHCFASLPFHHWDDQSTGFSSPPCCHEKTLWNVPGDICFHDNRLTAA